MPRRNPHNRPNIWDLLFGLTLLLGLIGIIYIAAFLMCGIECTL
jgi:hypothetical protein